MIQENKQVSRNYFLFKFIVVVIAFSLVAFSVWSFKSYRQAKGEALRLKTIENQNQNQEQEIDNILTQLKKHMILPNEKPTLATVTNIEELSKNQPFFKDAQNGDKIIIYPNVQKAIIFSPERDIIVNVGTLLLGDVEKDKKN